MSDREWVANRHWFHAIDFGDGVVSPGRFGPEVPPNYTLYGVFELLQGLQLDRARCLDVGAMDGLTSFITKRLGAREVVACDMAERPTFLFGRERLGLDIDYKTPVTAQTLPETFGDASADLIVMAGVLYHVYDPMGVLVACRRCLRPGGYLIVETTHDFWAGGPTMSFNPIDDSVFGIDLPNVYWRPSRRALAGMLQLAGFSVVASRTVNARLAMLAQANHPQDIPDRATRIVAVQDKWTHAHYKEQDFDAIRRGQSADIDYLGPRDHRFLYRGTHKPSVPYQPRWQPSTATARTIETGLSLAVHASQRLAELGADLTARVSMLAAKRLVPKRVVRVRQATAKHKTPRAAR